MRTRTSDLARLARLRRRLDDLEARVRDCMEDGIGEAAIIREVCEIQAEVSNFETEGTTK